MPRVDLTPGRSYRLPSGRTVVLVRIGRGNSAQCHYVEGGEPQYLAGRVSAGDQVTFRPEWLELHGKPVHGVR